MARLDALKGLERSSIAPRFRAAGFLRRAAVRLAHPDGRGDRGAVAQARRRSRRAAGAAGQGRAADRAQPLSRRRRSAPHPLSAPPGRSTKRARSCGSSPSGWRVRTKTPSTPAMASTSCASPALRPSRSRLPKPSSSARTRPSAPLSLAELLDRLSARLGARAVTRRELIEAHLPEQAEAAAPATLGEGAACVGEEPRRG